MALARRRSQMRTFVAQFVAQSGGRLWGTTVLMLLGGLLEGIGLLMLVPLVGLLIPGGGRTQAVAERWFEALGATTPLVRLGMVLALFVVVIVLRGIVLTLRDRRLAGLRLDFVERQRIELMRALGQARWQDIAGLHHARVTSAIGSDIQRIAAATHFLLQAAVATIMLAAQWLLTLLIAPALAGIGLVMLAGGAAFLLPSLHRASRAGDDLTEGQLRMMHVAGQFLAGLKLAMAQNTQDTFGRDFADSARTLTQQQRAFEHRQSVARIAVASASALVGAGMLLIGMWLTVPVASLLAAIVVLSRMSGPAQQIQQSAQNLATLLPAHVAFAALLGELAHSGHATGRGAATILDGEIVFDSVSYRHPDGAGLVDIDVRLLAGQVVGVAGASGAGETTFIDLLAGLLAPMQGRITVGGIVLDERNAVSHRDGIAYVGQDSFLINDTIRRNLTLGLADREGWDEESLWVALDRIGIAAMVRALPEGLDTMVAERGARLSGGERQRIALARALLRQPRLLILDEATNAIDVIGERAILDSLTTLAGRPTIVIVAHRSETLVPCERLLLFDAGQLKEDRHLMTAVERI